MNLSPQLRLRSREGDIINITKTPFSIASSNADYKFPEERLSGTRTIFIKHALDWHVIDENSNGIFVNGVLIKNQSLDLQDGDLLKLGAVGPELRVEFVENEVRSEEIGKKRKMSEASPTGKNEEEFLQKCFEELTCSICSAVFIKAVTLNCSHSFCSFCLNYWRASKKTCPICRKEISNVYDSLVIDNIINKLMERCSEEVKEKRNSIIQSRASANPEPPPGNPTAQAVVWGTMELKSTETASFPEFKLKSSKGEIITIKKSPFSIGRAFNADYKILNSSISRMHCSFVREGSNWCIVNESTNGTFINGTPIEAKSGGIKNGDMIRLGAESFKFEVQGLENQEETKDKKKTNESSLMKRKRSDVSEEFIEDCFAELSCSICSGLFIKAVTLNCSHSFCSYCLEHWSLKKTTCPICRKRIRHVHDSLVINNVINKLMVKASDEVKEEREKSILSRRSNKKPKNVPKTIAISTNFSARFSTTIQQRDNGVLLSLSITSN